MKGLFDCVGLTSCHFWFEVTCPGVQCQHGRLDATMNYWVDCSCKNIITDAVRVCKHVHFICVLWGIWWKCTEHMFWLLLFSILMKNKQIILHIGSLETNLTPLLGNHWRWIISGSTSRLNKLFNAPFQSSSLLKRTSLCTPHILFSWPFQRLWIAVPWLVSP